MAIDTEKFPVHWRKQYNLPSLTADFFSVENGIDQEQIDHVSQKYGISVFSNQVTVFTKYVKQKYVKNRCRMEMLLYEFAPICL